MIRSDSAITRLIVFPFGVLLALYLAVVGGGGGWLYHQVRTVETRLLIDEVTAALEPLAKKLGAVDAAAAMRQREPWLIEDLQALFAAIPSLRNVSVRGPDAGLQMAIDSGNVVTSRDTSALPAGPPRAKTDSSAAQRLHTESDPMFLIRFELTRAPEPFVRLDFGFDRAMLLSRVNEGVAVIKRSIIGFVVVGTVSILLALAITVVAKRVTRKMEVHFQEIYQRAWMTEIAAALVHDLRNPLAALRAKRRIAAFMSWCRRVTRLTPLFTPRASRWMPSAIRWKPAKKTRSDPRSRHWKRPSKEITVRLSRTRAGL